MTFKIQSASVTETEWRHTNDCIRMAHSYFIYHYMAPIPTL